MISQRKLLLLVSFSAALWIVYQLIFILPELIDALALIQKLPGNQGAAQAFSEIFGGFIIQLIFFGAVALWSYNEAFEKAPTSAMELSKRDDTSSPNPQVRTYLEKGVGQANYAEIMKLLGIIFIVGSIGFLLWTIYNTFVSTYSFETSFDQLITNLFLFAASAIIGAVLWTKAKEETDKKGKTELSKDFRQEYEEQKKREMEDRL